MQTLLKLSLLAAFTFPAWNATAQAQIDMDKLGQCLERTPPQTRIERCNGYLSSSAKTPPYEALALQARGWAYRESGRSDAALADFTRAMQLEPRFWALMWPRAEINGEMRQYEAAISDLSELSKHQPDVTSLHGFRAIALDNLGRGDEALAAITLAIDGAANEAERDRFRFSRANIYEGLHRFAESRAEYAAIAKNPEFARSGYRGVGRASYLMGDIAGAIQAFDAATKIDPTDGYMAIWLFLAETRAGRPNPAAKLRAGLVRSAPAAWPTPIIRLLLGEISEAQVPPIASMQGWSEADRRKAANCEAAFFLGELRAIQGNRAQAMQLYRKAVDSGLKEFVEYRAASFRLKS